MVFALDARPDSVYVCTMLFIRDGQRQGAHDLEELHAMREAQGMSPDAAYWDKLSSAWCPLPDSAEELEQTYARLTAVPQEKVSPPQPPRVKKPPLSNLIPAEEGNRIVAAAVDFVFCGVVGVKVAEMSPDSAPNDELISAVLAVMWICRDVLFGGRSLGRWLTLTRVVELERLRTPRLLTSLKRNLVSCSLLGLPWLVGMLVNEHFPQQGFFRAAAILVMLVCGGIFLIVAAGAFAQDPDPSKNWCWWNLATDTLVVRKTRDHENPWRLRPRSAGSAP